MFLQLAHLRVFQSFFSLQTASDPQGKSEHELRPVLEGIFFYSCIWLELQVFAADNDSQVDGRLVQREAGRQVQRGLLRADGRRSLSGVQVFRIELSCCLLSDRSQTSTPIHLKHCIAPIHPKGRLMGSPSRFQDCVPHMPFQCQSNAASSLINWLDIFT